MPGLRKDSPRKARIIMSFGRRGRRGEPLSDPAERDAAERRAALAYTAVKGIIEEHKGAALDVDRCIRHYGQITPAVYDEIAEADVVVAILDGINPTVVFELAFRHTLRGQIVLVVTDQSAVEEAIPFYLKDWAFIQFSKEFHDALLRAADDTINFPDLTFEHCELSPGLMRLRATEDGWGRDLCEAIDAALNSEPTPSPYFKRVAAAVLHEDSKDFRMGPWGSASNYPLSILKADFSKMSDPHKGLYAPEDLVQGPIVFDANWRFARFYDLHFREGEALFSQLRKKAPMVSAGLIMRLTGEGGGRCLTHKDWDKEKFVEDQARLAKWVLFYDPEPADPDVPQPDERDLYAKEPIRLAEDHPCAAMRGECFLPCLIAKRHSGDFPNGPHSIYLRIAYIEVTQLADIAYKFKAKLQGGLV